MGPQETLELAGWALPEDLSPLTTIPAQQSYLYAIKMQAVLQEDGQAGRAGPPVSGPAWPSFLTR